jgi:hypothetical protein
MPLSDPAGQLFRGPTGDAQSSTCCKKDKSYYISTYYGTVDRHLKDAVNNYVGGYVYWYFLQDMAPNTKPELVELMRTIRQQ